MQGPVFDAKERWILHRTSQISAQRGNVPVWSREDRACREQAEREWEEMQGEGEVAA